MSCLSKSFKYQLAITFDDNIPIGIGLSEGKISEKSFSSFIITFLICLIYSFRIFFNIFVKNL